MIMNLPGLCDAFMKVSVLDGAQMNLAQESKQFPNITTVGQALTVLVNLCDVMNTQSNVRFCRALELVQRNHANSVRDPLINHTVVPLQPFKSTLEVRRRPDEHVSLFVPTYFIRFMSLVDACHTSFITNRDLTLTQLDKTAGPSVYTQFLVPCEEIFTCKCGMQKTFKRQISATTVPLRMTSNSGRVLFSSVVHAECKPVDIPIKLDGIEDASDRQTVAAMCNCPTKELTIRKIIGKANKYWLFFVDRTSLNGQAIGLDGISEKFSFTPDPKIKPKALQPAHYNYAPRMFLFFSGADGDLYHWIRKAEHTWWEVRKGRASLLESNYLNDLPKGLTDTIPSQEMIAIVFESIPGIN
jgi:hypothetical protein